MVFRSCTLIKLTQRLKFDYSLLSNEETLIFDFKSNCAVLEKKLEALETAVNLKSHIYLHKMLYPFKVFNVFYILFLKKSTVHMVL